MLKGNIAATARKLLFSASCRVRAFENFRVFAETAVEPWRIRPRSHITGVDENVTIDKCYDLIKLQESDHEPLPKSTKKKRPTVLIVDDDSSVLRAIARLIRAAGFEVRTFERPGLLLAFELPKNNACLVLDLNLPEMNGVELYQALAVAGRALPVIMITSQSDDAKTRRLLNQINAVEVLFKPFDGDYLMNAIERALAASLGA